VPVVCMQNRFTKGMSKLWVNDHRGRHPLCLFKGAVVLPAQSMGATDALTRLCVVQRGSMSGAGSGTWTE